MVGKARKQLALDYIGDLERLDTRLKELKAQIAEAVAAQGSSLVSIDGVGPLGAGKTLAEVIDVRRFPSRRTSPATPAPHPSTYPPATTTGTGSTEAANRRLNHVLHIAAITQTRMPGPGQDYYRRKRDQGKTHLEALRCLKRRLSDAVYRCLMDDLAAGSPGGQVGASLQSSATDLIPMASTSEQSLPGLAHDLRRTSLLCLDTEGNYRLGSGSPSGLLERGTFRGRSDLAD